MRREPVIVVGTTPDYVAKICKKYPGVALFVLDARFHDEPFHKGVDRSSLLFASLEDFERMAQSVHRYLSANNLSPAGVACFDCESLIAASKLAFQLGMPFPSLEAIIHTRNKIESRRIWTESKVPCPRAALASNLEESLECFHVFNRDIVLKPVSGSGSELLFHCKSEGEIKGSVRIMEAQLATRTSSPLFQPIPGTPKAAPIDPCEAWIVEEFTHGPEFSCDFLLYEGNLIILRETGKIKAPGQTFGSILAYTFPPWSLERSHIQNLSNVLEKAATVLGFVWGHFMADFIIRDGHTILLEMTPRPGGDSIPDLVETATGYDLIGMYLDMVSGKLNPSEPPPLPSETFASMHLYAPAEGTITHLDPSQILSLPWVKALVLKKRVGDQVTLPHHDYDNRLLGYCIISADPSSNLVSVYQTLQRLLKVSIST